MSDGGDRARDDGERRRDEVLLAGNRDVLALIAQDAALTQILDAVTTMVEAQSPDGALASVLIVGEDGKSLRHGSAPSLPDAYNQMIDGMEIGPAAGSCGTAAYRGGQVIVADIGDDPLWEDWRELALSHGLRACWSTPVLSSDGKVLATFAVYYREPRCPSSWDQQLIDQVTRTVAIALQHDAARGALVAATASAEAVAARSRRLQDLAARLSAALRPDQVVAVATDYAMEALGAQAGCMVLLDAEGTHLELAGASGHDDEVKSRFSRFPLDAPLPLAQVARSGKPCWLTSEAQIRAEFPLLAEVRVGPGSMGVVPLRAGGVRVGSLGVCRDRPGEFAPDEQAEAMAVADQGAQALRRAARFQSEHQMAEALQRNLLTEPPQPSYLDLAVRYRPADRAAEVGGDWYDVFILPDQCLGLVIGDVAGHDLNAVVVMSQLRNMTRALACSDRAGGPAEVLAGLDRLMQHLGIVDLASVIFAKLERSEDGVHQLRWANAGHPPPLLVDGDGTARFLDVTGDLLLCVNPDTPRTDQVEPLPEGATLLLYTDGLVETRADSLAQRLNQLCGHVAALAGMSVQGFCAAVAGFAKDHDDDLALLALRPTA